jgi:hypothetical protein
MDPQSAAFTPRDDIWRFQSEMLRVQQTQSDHAERISRLERRQDDDARMKSVWGTSSPFPGVLSGTPQQGRDFIYFWGRLNAKVGISYRLRIPFLQRRSISPHSLILPLRSSPTASSRCFQRVRRPFQQPHRQPSPRCGRRTSPNWRHIACKQRSV